MHPPTGLLRQELLSECQSPESEDRPKGRRGWNASDCATASGRLSTVPVWMGSMVAFEFIWTCVSFVGIFIPIPGGTEDGEGDKMCLPGGI